MKLILVHLPTATIFFQNVPKLLDWIPHQNKKLRSSMRFIQLLKKLGNLRKVSSIIVSSINHNLRIGFIFRQIAFIWNPYIIENAWVNKIRFFVKRVIQYCQVAGKVWWIFITIYKYIIFSDIKLPFSERKNQMRDFFKWARNKKIEVTCYVFP